MQADTYLLAEKAAAWAGIQLSARAATRLERYHDWLTDEAIKAGGIGPNEAGRVWSRHVADSLLFGICLANVARCADLGSGVGLPGVPLAIAWPDVEFELVDRSGRRCDLMKRAIAVLRLDNCLVIHRNLSAVDNKYESLVARASLPPERLMIHVKRLLASGGTAVIGLSTTGNALESIAAPSGWSATFIRVPPEILDTSRQLLRIAAD